MKTLPSSAYSADAVARPRDGRQQLVLRHGRLRAGVLQHEAAGSVGVLRQAGRRAHLPEQRRLLIAGDAAERHRLEAERRRDLAVDLARAAHLRQHAARHAQRAQQLVIPLERVDVEQQRARRVAGVGDVQAAVGELPEQPRVDRAERELAGLGARARAVDVVENPGELRAREVRVEHQTGALAEQRLGALRSQAIADVRRAPILPDDGVGDGLAGLAIPHDRGLALVGDADRGDVARTHARAGQHLHGDAGLRRPDLQRVVLDPAWLRKDLSELALRDSLDPAVPIEQDSPRARRALIQREDVRHVTPPERPLHRLVATVAREGKESHDAGNAFARC